MKNSHCVLPAAVFWRRRLRDDHGANCRFFCANLIYVCLFMQIKNNKMFWTDGRERHGPYWSSSSASTCRLCFSFPSLSLLSYISPPPLSRMHRKHALHASCMPSGNLMGAATSRWSHSLSRCNLLMLNRCYFIVVGPRLRPFSSAARKRKKGP